MLDKFQQSNRHKRTGGGELPDANNRMDGPERNTVNEERRTIELSDEQFEAIANRVHEKVIQDLYVQAGKGSIKALLFLIGALFTAIAASIWAWFAAKEHWF
jgi:hypothetical protein